MISESLWQMIIVFSVLERLFLLKIALAANQNERERERERDKKKAQPFHMQIKCNKKQIKL